MIEETEEPKNSKTISCKVPIEVYDKINLAAKKEYRNLASFCIMAMLERAEKVNKNS